MEMQETVAPAQSYSAKQSSHQPYGGSLIQDDPEPSLYHRQHKDGANYGTCGPIHHPPRTVRATY